MSEVPIYSGRPMEIADLLNFEQAIDEIPNGAKVVTIEEARDSLPVAKKLLIKLQSISDNAADLTEELDIILESYDSNHDHVTELADYLATMIHSWHQVIDEMEKTGTKMACLDPGRLEWYGVVDEQLVLYSWAQGEEDIEWYHEINSSFFSRKPLIEA
ncbi:MAG TPA: DUF2203 family protein [Candidatus Poseidoniaceae archaeon]|jgi:hypothetical protein|nr:DUF2203 family protein [Candidatus Poseidoniaceae archaeon]|tara:strand:+ start:215 stop:691 length:477 start_codon:yes stop_codon:yes gene_type:complete